MPTYCYKSENSKSKFYKEATEIFFKSHSSIVAPKDEFGKEMKRVPCGKVLLDLRGDGWDRRGLQ